MVLMLRYQMIKVVEETVYDSRVYLRNVSIQHSRVPLMSYDIYIFDYEAGNIVENCT